jgi:hypothetical protein
MAITYVAMTSIDARMLDRELKKGSAELIILSIVEPRARHGYEISKLIETRSGGHLKFHVASGCRAGGSRGRVSAAAAFMP